VFVVDEYGVVQGLMTPRDLLEAITGELQPGMQTDAWARERPDGIWELDGLMPVSELRARLGIRELPEEERGRYNTVAGLLMSVSGHLPEVGEQIDCAGWCFEVVALEGPSHRPRAGIARPGGVAQGRLRRAPMLSLLALSCPQCSAPLPRAARWRTVNCSYCGATVVRTGEETVERESFPRRAAPGERKCGCQFGCGRGRRARPHLARRALPRARAAGHRRAPRGAACRAPRRAA
jgi:hypothetical protein